jgi:hypothetical protein
VSEQEIKKELDEVLSVVKELKERRRPDKAHAEEHEYLRQMIEEHKARREFWQSIRTRTVEASVWTLVVAIVTACAFTIKSWLQGSL